MKKLLLALSLAVCTAALAQNVSNGPVTKKTSGADVNNINEDLNFAIARTLRFKTGSVFRFDSGATITGVADFRTALGLVAIAASGSASDLSTGTVPDARFPATLPALAGVNLTGLNANNLGSGTVPTARLYTTAAGYNITNGSTIDAWGAKAVPSGTVVGTTDTQTLSGKTISGGANTLSNIGNSSLTNSAVTIAGTSVSLGGAITLDAIDNAIATTGLIARTVANTRAARTITGTSPVQVANGNGVSGNPTVSVDAATTSGSGVVELATTAEALAGSDSVRAVTPAAGEARALQGTLTRRLRDALYSDGVTTARRSYWNLSTAGSVAGLPISIPFEFQIPTSNLSFDDQIAWFATATPAIEFGSRLYLTTTGSLHLQSDGAVANTDYRRLAYAGFRAAYSGQTVRGMVVFSSADSTSSPSIYLNGIDATASFTATTGGTAPNWMPSTLVTTRFYSHYNAAPGWFQPHAPILGALSAGEVLEWTQTGRLPWWCEITTGSAVVLNTANFSQTNIDSFTGASATGFTAVNAAGDPFSNIRTGSVFSFTAGEKFEVRFTSTKNSVGAIGVYLWGDSEGASSNPTNMTDGTADRVVTFTATKSSTSGRIQFDPGVNACDIVVSNFAVRRLGPIFKPVIQPGVAIRDAGGNNLAGVLSSGVVPITTANRGSITASLTWSGTHEGKSLVGAQAIPSNAVITRITRKATMASSGSGCTIGSTNSATRWQALDTYTTAKEVATLANQLPAGTAANDLDIIVDPDTANYTGSITVTVHYEITDGAP